MNDPASLFRLDNRVALITGAGSGIGRATALCFAAAGATVIVTDRDDGAAQSVAEEIGRTGVPALSRTLDVAEEDAVVSSVRHVLDDLGRIDVLVNNAGRGARMPAEQMPTETWEAVLQVNLTGSFLSAREVGRAMLAQGKGAIVNVASIMGLVGGGLYPNPAYQATKGGIVNMTRALALDWADRGVRVNAVAPTFAATPLTEGLLKEPGMADEIVANTPLGRLVEPHEVAAAILFLASDAAAMITGHTLPVDGDAVRWASLDGNHLLIYSFAVLDDGRFELQALDTAIDGDRLEIRFQRVMDGEVVIDLQGTAVRVE